MEESATTSSLAAALEHYLAAANKEQLFRIPLGKTTIIGGTLTTELSSDDTGTTLIVKKPPNDFAKPEHFDPQLATLQTQLAECGIVLEPIAEEEAPKKSRLRQFFSLKEEPNEKKDIVAFEVTAENEKTAIAALIEKTETIKRIALETQAKEIVQSIANRIPQNMPPELAAQVLEGLFTLGVKTAQKHKIPVPSIAAGELGHAPLETAEKTTSLN